MILLLVVAGFALLCALLVSHYSCKFTNVPPASLLATLWVTIKSRGSCVKVFTYIGKQGPLVSTHGFPGLLKPMVIINDYQLMKSLYQQPVFSGRPDDEKWTVFSGGNYGITFANGPEWEEQRRFAQKQFKHFGIGTKRMQEHLELEIHELLNTLDKQKGQLMSPNRLFTPHTLNLMWRFLTGQRIVDEGHEATERSVEFLHNLIHLFGYPESLMWVSTYSFETFLKINQYIPIIPHIAKWNQENIEFLTPLVQKHIQRRQKALEEENLEEPTCYIDAFLMEMRKTQGNKSSSNETLTMNEENGLRYLEAAVGDLFVAGGDTTSLTLTWALLHLIRNPGIQEKIYHEVLSCTGSDRLPNLYDRASCPYLEAFVHEVLRVSPAALNSIPHAVLDDVRIGNFYMKKGTVHMMNLLAINNDPEIWGDPENFRPERYISAGQFVRPEALATFVPGRRKCPGEHTAKDTIFLMIASICQRFRLLKDPKVKEQKLYSAKSPWYAPAQFYMIVEERRGNRYS